MGKEFSYSFRNFIGHFYDGHSFNQQLSFYGISGTEYVNNTFLRFGLNFRYFIDSKHYVLLLSNLGFHNDNFFDVFSFFRSIFGGGIGYSYDSPIEPIDVSWSMRGLTFPDTSLNRSSVGSGGERDPLTPLRP